MEGIPKRLLEEGVSFQSESKDWSRPAIKKLYKEYLCRWKVDLPSAIVWERDSYAEGVKSLPEEYRKKYFFGSECWPDLALLQPVRIAIELDHGDDGVAVRNALTKASFNVVVGEWDWCYILFFDETKDGRLKEKSGKGKERDILAAYEVLFRTKVLFVRVDDKYKVIAG